MLSPTKGHRCIILLIMSASAWYGMRIAYNIDYHNYLSQMDCAWARLCPSSNFESGQAASITFFKKSLILVDATVSHSHNWVIPLSLCQAGACLLLVYWHSLILTPLSFPFLLSFLLHYIGLEIVMVFLNSLLDPNSADIQFAEVDQLHWYSSGVSGCYWYGVNSCWPRCWIVDKA